MCLCVVTCSLKAGVESVEVIWQAVCRADGAGGVPVVCDVLQASPHLPVSSGIKAVQLLSVLPLCRCDGFPQSVLGSFVLVAYLSVYPGLLVGELPDLYGGHDVIKC